MKKIVLLLIWACLAACTTDTLPGEDSTPLEISVEVAAYDRGINGVATRASVNNGVVTSFAAGDDLGLFVVAKDGTLVANNYRYMVQKTGNGYRVDGAGNVIASDVYYNEDYTYFAYAPYNSMYDGCKSVQEITDKYKAVYPTLYTDQSTQERYNAADLLVCKTAQKTGSTLRLSFTHAMSQLKIYYNGEEGELAVESPVELTRMYRPSGSVSYSYITLPGNGVEVYGTAVSKQTIEDSEDDITLYSYWETKIDLVENGSAYVTISSQPTESYRTAGVDMGFPSGCIWANHNLGTETAQQQAARGGVWYDGDGNPKTELMESELHACFDRGDYFSWGELKTKYEKPTLLFGDNGRITSTGDALSAAGNTVIPLISGSSKGYYPETYVDRSYSYADIDGNIAGSEYDVVRNTLWKGEWRIPNEDEIDELMRNCDISVYDWYYEDNVRYAPWIAEKDAEGSYKNLHPDNSEFYGTDEVRPFRYLVTIFKFVSKINGEVLYFPGGTWSDWSIDMLACASRSSHGLMTASIPHSDYGGMYYFASSASHEKEDCASYMELETQHTYNEAGKLVALKAIKKTSSYVDDNGNTIYLEGLTQNGHRYTGMLIRPVYGGRNWNINTRTRNIIHINVE